MAPDTIGDKAEEVPSAHNAQVNDSTSAALICKNNEPLPNVGKNSESALSFKFPEFDPEEAGADAVEWCKVVDTCLGQYPLQGRALIIALSESLKGSASSWLSQVTYEDMTWVEFKFNFLACYDSENTCAATMISINNSRPKEEESYAAYASRIVNSFLTRWKDLTPEQIAVSLALAHISRFDSRVQRMAHMTDIMTREKLVKELSGFSYLKHKLQPNPHENNDLTPEKRVKTVPVQRSVRNRNSTKRKTVTVTSNKSVDIAPENLYELQPNFDENRLKIKLVKSTISIERPARKRRSTKLKTATATSSTPMEVMPEICFGCGEEGHNAMECPKTSATASALLEPAGEQRQMDTSDHECVCCGTQPATGTLRQPESIRHPDLLAGSSSAATHGTVYIEILTEAKDHDVDQSNNDNVMLAVPSLESSSVAPNNVICIDIDTEENQNLNQINEETNKSTDKYVEDINQNVIQTNVENGPTDVYAELVLLEQLELVPNAEEIECGVCMDNYQPGQGAVLRECVHAFCKECLSDVVKHSEEPAVSCPAMGCPGFLQEREIRALVAPEEYERWLAKGLAVAESGARNAFHCRTADCQGWAMCDPGVTRFLCPVCDVMNCVTCQAIHENETCEEYSAKQISDGKTKTYLDSWLSLGKAMHCPECNVIITKRDGCDWIKCTACKTEICWATRGRRWGPSGRGDTSAGCRCRVNQKKCHPSCRDCH